jgi:hypothetical protein
MRSGNDEAPHPGWKMGGKLLKMGPLALYLTTPGTQPGEYH